MNKINIGLIGYGNVGQGVVKLLSKKKKYLKDKFQVEINIKSICDRSIEKKAGSAISSVHCTTEYKEILGDPDIDVVVELIGGVHPAKEIVMGALQASKHVVTANKSLISAFGQQLFKEAQDKKKNILYESAVMAGIPVIRMLTEGLAGNKYEKLYGIINGTCNFILSEMSGKNLSFSDALQEAQRCGFAESDPTLDINGMDSAHKLSILVALAFGRFVSVKDIHTEGITHISHDDIEHAESLGLAIKLLAIAKRTEDSVEAHVHPTLISQDHPLASINGISNALFIDADPIGNVLISGQGAGQMTAASGVVSDLIHLGSLYANEVTPFAFSNIYTEASSIQMRSIDEISTKFYLRFMATDKPGVLSQITGVLGNYGISINSVTQKAHNRAATVPVIILTELSTEKMVRQALDEIHKMPIVKAKPVAIRMEKLI